MNEVNNNQEWERISAYTYRLKIDGGYLYRYNAPNETGLVFVPILQQAVKDSYDPSEIICY